MSFSVKSPQQWGILAVILGAFVLGCNISSFFAAKKAKRETEMDNPYVFIAGAMGAFIIVAGIFVLWSKRGGKLTANRGVKSGNAPESVPQSRDVKNGNAPEFMPQNMEDYPEL